MAIDEKKTIGNLSFALTKMKKKFKRASAVAFTEAVLLIGSVAMIWSQNNKLNETQKELSKAQASNSAYEVVINDKNQIIEEMQDTLKLAETLNSQMQSQNQMYQTTIDALVEAGIENPEELAFVLTQMGELDTLVGTVLETQGKTIEDFATRQEAIDEALTILEVKMDISDASYKELEEKYIAVQKELKTTKTSLTESQKQVKSLSTKITELEDAKKTNDTELAKLKEDKKNNESKIKELEEKNKTNDAELTKLKEEKKTNEAKIKELEAKVKKLEEESSSTSTTSHAKCIEDLNAAYIVIGELDEQLDELEGYYDALYVSYSNVKKQNKELQAVINSLTGGSGGNGGTGGNVSGTDDEFSNGYEEESDDELSNIPTGGIVTDEEVEDDFDAAQPGNRPAGDASGSNNNNQFKPNNGTRPGQFDEEDDERSSSRGF